MEYDVENEAERRQVLGRFYEITTMCVRNTD